MDSDHDNMDSDHIAEIDTDEGSDMEMGNEDDGPELGYETLSTLKNVLTYQCCAVQDMWMNRELGRLQQHEKWKAHLDLALFPLINMVDLIETNKPLESQELARWFYLRGQLMHTLLSIEQTDPGVSELVTGSAAYKLEQASLRLLPPFAGKLSRQQRAAVTAIGSSAVYRAVTYAKRDDWWFDDERRVYPLDRESEDALSSVAGTTKGPAVTYSSGIMSEEVLDWTLPLIRVVNPSQDAMALLKQAESEYVPPLAAQDLHSPASAFSYRTT